MPSVTAQCGNEEKNEQITGESPLQKEEFLSQIKNSLQHTLLPAASSSHPGSFTGYSFDSDAPIPKLLEQFKQELEALTGRVHVLTDTAQLLPTILAILAHHQADRLIAWDEADLELPGLLAELTAAGIRIEDSFTPPAGSERLARLAQLDGVKVGLTGAAGGLADTGALALISGPGRGRLASLLPPVHIALLPVKKLYPALPAFLQANPDAIAGGRILVFIACPSRSGDIEMTLSIGVHGPGEIHVILLP
jgi:L-lactate dehydrogenase complex protein LldG